jgi:saccharopine dehydrogenase (NAD+, L-lysine forming)
MAPTVLHVRAETKPLEHRSAVTPSIAKQLVDAGYTVNVERSELSIFDDAEYEVTGASLVPTGSWIDAPSDHIVVGLKELPEEDFPLKHTVSQSSVHQQTLANFASQHVQFAHCPYRSIQLAYFGSC